MLIKIHKIKALNKISKKIVNNRYKQENYKPIIYKKKTEIISICFYFV